MPVIPAIPWTANSTVDYADQSFQAGDRPAGLIAPANFIAVGGNTLADLSWDVVATATDYEVRVDLGSWISTSNATSYQFISLTNDQEYDFDVRATTVGVDGPVSSFAATPNTGLIHFDNFSNYQVGVPDGEHEWIGHPDVTVQPDPDDAANDTLRFFMDGTPDGDAGAELGFTMDSHQEIWVKYRFYVPSNYVHRDSTGSDNNKGYQFLYGPTKTGWDVHMRFEWGRISDNESSLVTYSNVLQRTYSNNLVQIYANGEDSDGRSQGQMVAIATADHGNWVEFVSQVIISDRGLSNGRIRSWKDNAIICDWRDLDNSSDVAASTNEFNGGYHIGYSNSGYLVDTSFNMDDYYIGVSAASIGFTVPA